MKRILVTGGTGYIGSHTVVQLLEAGYEVSVLDNLSNSRREAIDRVRSITGREVDFHEIDLLDAEAVSGVFSSAPVDAVIHFAGLKAVGESVGKPLHYYHNNLTGTFHLLQAMADHGCGRIVFSSSATVYGDPPELPIREDFPLTATNPYGWTKLMLEQVLTDVQKANPGWGVVLLRYFNPVGAHPSGLIGEDPRGIPNNLVPYIAQVAVGRLERLQVFGNDYPTPDGTGVRDYIHVVDLADGHLRALEFLASGDAGTSVFNLGTGSGASVLEMVDAFSKAAGKEIPYDVRPRRAGDIAACYADPSKAEKALGWKAERTIDAMCRDTWNWQSKNPEGLG